MSTNNVINNANPGNINLMNKSGFYNKEKVNIFSNIYLILSIFSIALLFFGYAIYKYTQSKSNLNILANSSYYGTDVSVYEPIFQDKAKTINDCINICQNDITCDGITYNDDTQSCLGTKNGQVRNENANYSAWVKPPSDKVSKDSMSKDLSKAVLVGYTKKMTVIDGKKIQNPYMLGYFAYSFNLTIYDFYKNYGSWRHVFHRGTDIAPGTSLKYQSWENLLVDFPMQSIGVWLAPFTNNLRIAVTTTSLSNKSYGSYQDAFIQKCNNVTGQCYVSDMPSGKWADTSRSGDGSNPNTTEDTYVEYFDHDLQNIPINKQINITLNFRGNNVETLFNGKIIKINSLDGVPKLCTNSLYVMNDLTFGGEISNLLYYPDTLLLGDIQSIIELQPPETSTTTS
jgi:hypothetical protein